jgi:hypothetical protein
MFTRAMEMLDTGMGEQFAADRDALSENNKRDDTLYDAGVGDHVPRPKSGRVRLRTMHAATNGAKASRTGAKCAGTRTRTTRTTRSVRSSTTSVSVRKASRRAKAPRPRRARCATWTRRIEGKHEDAQIKQQQRMQSFLSTPARCAYVPREYKPHEQPRRHY